MEVSKGILSPQRRNPKERSNKIDSTSITLFYKLLKNFEFDRNSQLEERKRAFPYPSGKGIGKLKSKEVCYERREGREVSGSPRVSGT